MKRAIFCLLTFCAFETVFADQFKKDVDKLRSESNVQVNYITNTILYAVGIDIQTAERKGINTGAFSYKYGYGCLGIPHKAYDGHLNLRYYQMENCLHEAAKKKNIETANSCREKYIVGLGKDAKLIHAIAKACIAKCPKTDCTKMTIKDFQDVSVEKK